MTDKDKEIVSGMISWFFEHYEDPAESLPYESREGGYIPIYGPLQDASEILNEAFCDQYDEKLIEMAIAEIGPYDVWTPKPPEDFFDVSFDHEFSEHVYQNANEALREIRDNLNSSMSQELMRMRFLRVYAITEGFLGNFLAKYIREKADSIIENIEEHDELKKISIPLPEVAKAINEQNEDLLASLIKQTVTVWYEEKNNWHRFSEARKIYGRYGIPIKFSALAEHQHIRDDIVHRDGRKKGDNGPRLIMTTELIEEVLEDADKVIDSIYHHAKK